MGCSDWLVRPKFVPEAEGWESPLQLVTGGKMLRAVTLLHKSSAVIEIRLKTIFGWAMCWPLRSPEKSPAEEGPEPSLVPLFFLEV